MKDNHQSVQGELDPKERLTTLRLEFYRRQAEIQTLEGLLDELKTRWIDVHDAIKEIENTKEN